jgi:NAD+ kinase
VAVEIEVDGERFIRFAGDGLIASTPLGSTAYTLAAGGPVLAPGTDGLVLTPLAPHGGVCPPLVTTPDTHVLVTLNPGNAGARVEVDGQVLHDAPPGVPLSFALARDPAYAELVSLGEHEGLIAGLRRRRLLLDSPRVLARDEREAAAAARAAGASAGT